jgi:hypothetical protein
MYRAAGVPPTDAITIGACVVPPLSTSKVIGTRAITRNSPAGIR